MLKEIHQYREDPWWTESCLRLRDLTCTREGDYDYDHWRQHDLDQGHLNQEQKDYFENEAVWPCTRCEDVGQRNGQKLAHKATHEKELSHQIKAQHSGKSGKKLSAFAFGGLREALIWFDAARQCSREVLHATLASLAARVGPSLALSSVRVGWAPFQRPSFATARIFAVQLSTRENQSGSQS